MSPPPNPAGSSSFPLTRNTVLERMKSHEPDARRAAFGDLADGYWKPIYTYIRLNWQASPEDAEDATQGFLAEALEKGWLDAYDASKARFRTFVRVCVDRFLMNRRQAAGRLKRGGAQTHLALDFSSAEADLLGRELSTPPDAEDFFRREFVRDLFARTVAAVREEFEARGQHVPVVLFERYDLDPDPQVSYASLAREFGLTPAQVTNHLAHVRRVFRQRALETLRVLSGSAEHFRLDARELFGLEVE